MKAMLKNSWLLVIIILVIAGFLRLYEITKLPPGFYPDEAMYANNGIEALETAPPAGGFKVFYPENYGREGLWSNIIGFFVVRFGHEPWIPRAVAAVFGILTVLGVYFLTKELFSKKIALLSSFFIATSFWHINFSRIAFRAIMSPFFLVWGIYFLLAAFRQIKEQKSPKFYILNFIFSGIFYGLGFHSYITYRVTPLLILIILLFYWFRTPILRTSDVQNINKNNFGTSDVQRLKFRKKILLSTFYFLLSTFIVALPLGLYFLKNPQDFFGRTTQISIFNSLTPIKDLGINVLKTAGMFNFAGDSNWRHNYPGRPELFWPVGILFLIGVFLAIKTLIQNSILRTSDVQNINKNDFGTSDVQKLKFGFLILFVWLIVASLPVIVSNEGLPHALRAILMIPPVFILAGIGGIWLYKILAAVVKNKKVLNIFIFIFLSLLFFEAYTTYFILWGQNPNTAGAFNQNYVDIGRQLNALSKETPKYVIVKASGVLVRGIPMPTQTIMFITDTFSPEKQKEKNIFYLLPEQINQIPENGYVVVLK